MDKSKKSEILRSIIFLQRLIRISYQLITVTFSVCATVSDNLKQMPSTIMVIAGFDPLRDGGFEYADKLKEYGVEVTMQIYKDQFHGFYHMANVLPEALDAVKATCKSINILFDK